MSASISVFVCVYVCALYVCVCFCGTCRTGALAARDVSRVLLKRAKVAQARKTRVLPAH